MTKALLGTIIKYPVSSLEIDKDSGDIRTKNLRQVVTAVADGANAVASVQRYLMEY